MNSTMAFHIVFLLTFIVMEQALADWVIEVNNGDNVTIPCDKNVTSLQDVAWLLPGISVTGRKLVLKYPNSDEKRTISDNGDLLIVNVDELVYGEYICTHRTSDGNYMYIKWGLNYYGPKVEDGFTKYHYNILNAAIPSSSFLFLILLVWLLNYFRYQEVPYENNTLQTSNEQTFEQYNSSVL